MRQRRMTQRELLGNHAAHRNAENVRGRNFEVLQHPCRIIGEHLNRVRDVGLVALAGAAIIEGDDAEGFGELLDQCGIPGGGTRAECP